MNLINNKFLDGLNKVVDCIWLSLLWFVCSIPIFTIGASTTAMYYTMNKAIRHDRSYVTSSFFSSFRANFKQATALWGIFLVVYLLLGFDCYLMRRTIELGGQVGFGYKAFLVLICLVAVWSLYVFPYTARFENTTKEILRNTLIIAATNFPWTILLAILFLAAGLLIYMYPPVAIVMPSMYHLFKNIIIERIFRKYMSEEDLQAERERTQVYH